MKIVPNRILAGRKWALITTAVVLLTTGVGVWLATRPPRYSTYSLRLGDAEHSALRFAYPADWEVTPVHYQLLHLQAFEIECESKNAFKRTTYQIADPIVASIRVVTDSIKQPLIKHSVRSAPAPL